MSIHAASLVYVSVASLAAFAGAITDIRSRRIPNHLTLPAFCIGLLLHFGFGGWRGLASSLLAALLAFGIFLLFFIAGGMGAGDVKLMTAAAAIAGTQSIGEMLIATAIAGGVCALIMAVSRGRLGQTFRNVGTLMAHHRVQGMQPHPELNVTNKALLRLPYGVAIAAGCLITLASQLHQA